MTDSAHFEEMWTRYAGPLSGQGREEARKVFYAGGLAVYSYLMSMVFQDGAHCEQIMARLEGLDCEFRELFTPEDLGGH